MTGEAGETGPGGAGSAGVPSPRSGARAAPQTGGQEEVPAGPAQDLAATRVWLVGMMGAGKSTVGRALAGLAGWPVVDTDRLVEQRCGRTVSEVFAEMGEPAFRRLEAGTVAELAAGDSPLVVSVGGGAVMAEANRTVMRASGTVVWLRAAPEVLVRRLGRAESRPLLAGAQGREGAQARVASLVAEREPLYRQAAHLVVDVGYGSAVDVARTVLAMLGGGQGQPPPGGG